MTTQANTGGGGGGCRLMVLFLWQTGENLCDWKCVSLYYAMFVCVKVKVAGWLADCLAGLCKCCVSECAGCVSWASLPLGGRNVVAPMSNVQW